MSIRGAKELQVVYLNDVELQEHGDRGTDFMLETVHLKAHALEHDLCAARVRDLLEDGGHLSRVERRGRKKDIELSRQ